MRLEILPDRTASAAGNMAADFLLLQRYPAQGEARLRHYEWRNPSFTFGYSQKIAWVREQVADAGHVDLCRRPTGGGVVDHREDWTYALVIPRGHSLEEQRAPESYRAVHQAIADALALQGVPAVLKQPDPAEASKGPGLCYEQAEVHDVISSVSGRKIAGAAQKRNKHGLLFQGYIWKPEAGAGFDWERFQEDFIANLAGVLRLEAVQVPWPEYAEGEEDGLEEQYSSLEWREYR